MFASAPLTSQPAALPPGGIQPQATSTRSDDASFAKLLSANAPPSQPPAPSAAPAPAPAAPPPKSAQGNGGNGDARAEAKPTQTPRKPTDDASKSSEATKDGGARAEDTTSQGTKSADSTDASQDSQDDDQDATKDSVDEFTSLLGLSGSGQARPDLPAGVQGHKLPGQAKDDVATDDSGAEHARVQGAGARSEARGVRGQQDAATARAAKAADDASDAQQGRQQKADASSKGFADQLREASTAGPRHAAAPGTASASPTGAIDAALAAQQGGAAVRGSAGTDTPTTSSRLQSPLNSPSFSAELGARVSVLAVDGVQQAELQLNPAEMGPVSVQIIVDGAQAQVSFHAAQAETRQALERSLPDLAAALQGSGLTLSGGGVFQQQAREQGSGNGGEAGSDRSGGRRAGGARVGAVEAASAGVPAASRRVGLLDTFA